MAHHIVTHDPKAEATLLALERCREAVRQAAHARDAGRYRGVAWSGLAPDPCAARTEGALKAAAADALLRRKAWREGGAGQVLQAVARAQRAAEAAHAAGERVRAALSRDAEREVRQCAQIAAEMEAQGSALLFAARAARDAIRAAGD